MSFEKLCLTPHILVQLGRALLSSPRSNQYHPIPSEIAQLERVFQHETLLHFSRSCIFRMSQQLILTPEFLLVGDLPGQVVPAHHIDTESAYRTAAVELKSFCVLQNLTCSKAPAYPKDLACCSKACEAKYLVNWSSSGIMHQ
jgi:hypothetical protein